MLLRFLPTLLILGLYFMLRSAHLAAPYGGVPAGEILSQSPFQKAVVSAGYYLRLLILPYPHNPYIASLPSSPVYLVLSGLAVMAIGAAAVLAAIRRDAVTAVGLVWTLSLLAPGIAVTLLQVTPTAAAERYAYGPSVGLVMAAVWWIFNAFSLSIERKILHRGLPGLAVLLTLLLLTSWSLESRARNAVWRDTVSFWQAASDSAPMDGFPHRELGIYLAKQENYGAAEKAFLRSVAIYEKTLGANDYRTAAALNSLGVLYSEQGRYETAEPILRRALEIRKTFEGNRPLDLAETLNNLAVLYHSNGKYTEALPFYERALKIRESALRPDHPETAQILNNLGSLHDRLGRTAEAESYYRRALAIRERAFRPDHPDIAETLNNLGALYYVQGRTEEAEPVLKRAIDIYEKIQGPDSPGLARSLNNLAAVYDSEGKYALADPLYRRSLALLEQTLGASHPAVVAGLENYAAMLRAAGRDGEAEIIEARIAKE